jgi:hypothetical protein
MVGNAERWSAGYAETFRERSTDSRPLLRQTRNRGQEAASKGEEMPFSLVHRERGGVHGAAALVLTLGALAAPTAAAGQATTEVDVQHFESSGEVVNPCTGEVELVSGQGTQVTREIVDGVGGLHRANIGTGVLFGDDSVVINHQADPGPSNFNANGATNVTDVIQIMTISRGSDENWIEHINHTDTITPTGDRPSEAFNVRQECLG